METLQKSFKYNIEANIEQMTAAEKTVAEYFLHMKKLEDLSADTVAKQLGVSIATLSRFAKKCGLSGYREFTALYRKSFVPADRVRDENNQLVLWSYQEILNRQYSLINEEQIHHIADQMSACGRIYICGRGNSGLSAEEIANRFKWLGLNTSCVKDTEEMKLTTLFLKPEDMVIGLSISGKQSQLLSLLDAAKEKGCFTVLATANTNKLLAVRVDECVIVPSLKNLNYGNLISPQFPMLLLGDMIYGEFVALNKGKAEEIQRKVQEILYKK